MWWLRTILAAFCGALLSAPANAEQQITLSGLPIWDSAPLLLMVREQPLAESGITFAFLPWQTPDRLNVLLLNGRVKVAVAPSPLLPLLRQRGLAADWLATSSIGGNLKILIRADDGPLTVPFKGGLPDLILRRLRQSEPGPHRPIRYTATPVEAMQLMLSGRAGGTFLAEPLATVAQKADPSLRVQGDVCGRWQAATSGAGCPVTGVYLTYYLSADLAVSIEAALADAYGRLAREPAMAAELLVQAFPNMRDAPLKPAFSGLRPVYGGPCSMAPLLSTLQALDDLSPVSLAGPLTASIACQE